MAKKECGEWEDCDGCEWCESNTEALAWDDFEQDIWICALRYALGRRTYITGVVADFILSRSGELTPRVISVMIRDIEECEDYGADCDKKSWMKLLEDLKS